MYFMIYGLTIIPVVLCGVPALEDVSKVNCPDCKRFPMKNFSHFSVIQKEKNKPTFLVGVRNGVLQVTMDGKLDYHISIPLGKSDYDRCRKNEKNMGMLDDHYDCGNIISWIIPHKATRSILACGYSIYHLAHCWKANETAGAGTPDSYTFYTNPERVSAVSDPYIFQSWSLQTVKRSGKLQRANIYSVDKDKLELEMDDLDSHFVSVYEFGNYIYYFFYDLSEEQIDDSSKVIYARIGRLCKYDSGGERGTPGRSLFQTFSKVRLICSTNTKNEAFQYNYIELTSTVTGDDGEVYIYVLFRAARPANDRLAICRYSVSKIDKAFSDKRYYDQTGTLKIVNAEDNDPRHKECNSSSDTRTTTFNQFKKIKKRLLHVSVVRPDGGEPVTVNSHSKVTRMLAETSTIANKSYDIVRLFDSNQMYELFVPVSFFNDPTVERFLTARKISEEALTINDVAIIKYNGPEKSPSSSPTATSTPDTSPSSTSGKPSSTQLPTTVNSTTKMNTTTTPNLTETTMPGNQSSRSPKSMNAPMNIPTTRRPSRTRSAEKATRSMSSDSSDRFIGQEKIIVATKKQLLFVPVASCSVYTSCRECVAAKNPYCAWFNDNCVQLKKTGNTGYIQDIKDGNYSKVCPSVNVTCEVRISKLIPRAEVTLQCSSSGVPTPHKPTWEKDGNQLTNGSNKGITINEGELKIRSYTLNTTGMYACHVDNGVTSQTCSVAIQGSSPEINNVKVARVAKKFILSCNASGYPQPTVMTKVGNKQKKGNTIEVEKGKTYQYIAYNAFGTAIGGIYQIISKTLEFRLVGEKWSDDLLNPSSQKYTKFKDEIMKGLQEIYKNNSFFQDAEISFKKGSVIAAVEISGLKTPSNDETDLTRDLEEAINDKKIIGTLNVSNVDEIPTTSADQQSTPAPTSLATTKDAIIPPAGKQTSLPTSLRTSLSSIRLPASTPMPSTRKPTVSSTPVVVASKAAAQDTSSSGVPLWLLFVLLILIALIVFIVGYFLGLRGVSCSKLYSRPRRCTKNSSCSEEDGPETKEGMSRSEKTRESERMLLKKHEGKNKSPPKPRRPSENNHLADNMSQEGSIEIKHNRDDNSRPGSGHSVC